MKRIEFYFDFVSPYAYLAFEQLPQVLEGLSYSVDYKPVVLGALLKHHGQYGPAEIAPKRRWIYRHVLWLGHVHGIPIAMPAAHPFNSLALLRLACALGRGGCVNRHGAETLFRWAWQGGHDASDAARLQALTEQMVPPRAPESEEVKAELRANTEQAIAVGVFGVPSCVVDGHCFWGLDGLAMLRAYLQDPAWFESDALHMADQRPGLMRPRAAD